MHKFSCVYQSIQVNQRVSFRFHNSDKEERPIPLYTEKEPFRYTEWVGQMRKVG